MTASESATVGHPAETHALRAIDACMDVYKVCRQAAAYCADQRGDYAEPHRIRMLHDCADIHLLAGDFIGRASPYHRQTVRLACEIARSCAEAFHEIERGDAQLRKLYAVCLQAVRTLQVFIGDAEAAPADTVADEASKESFPASDPPPTPAGI